MIKFAPSTWRCFLFCFIGMVLSAIWGVYSLMSYSASREVPLERYYRAVFVLQSLGGPASAESERIPPRIPYSDAAESLLHHPDKIFVLRHVADELAAVRAEAPKAKLFEAYARLGLGERGEAVRLLSAYVVGNDYNNNHYALLSHAFYELGDYSSLLLICSEWRERDPSCRRDRLVFTWSALYRLERYAQAREFMLAEGTCLGWVAHIYAAKAALAMGEEREAGLVFEELLAGHAGEAAQIRRLWEQLNAF